MFDDHTFQAIGAYGERLARLNPMPNIDKLAKKGMLFENAFCTNSICTPSRANIMTGRYSQTNGVLDLDGELPPARQYLPTEMKKLGYQTAMIGKWHPKDEPAAREFYDLTLDPTEVINRYKDPKYKSIIAGLKQEIIVQRRKYNETDEKYSHIKKVIDRHRED